LYGRVASTDNTLANGNYILQNSDRAIGVYSSPSLKATYSAVINGLAVAATATDIFTIKGSGTKTVKVTQISISGVAGTAITVPVDLLLRSTADTGGTSTTPTLVKHDSTNAAATAVVNAYTVNPTTGTLVGSIRSERVTFPLTAVAPAKTVYDFGVGPSQPIVLRGAAEQLCINLNAATVSASLINISIEFTEE
jgi:hypothetical protein